MSKPLPFWQEWLVDHLPPLLAWVIAAVLYLMGSAIGTIASDLWGYVITYRRLGNKKSDPAVWPGATGWH